jgi:hypothetical protein
MESDDGLRGPISDCDVQAQGRDSGGGGGLPRAAKIYILN